MNRTQRCVIRCTDTDTMSHISATCLKEKISTSSIYRLSFPCLPFHVLTFWPCFSLRICHVISKAVELPRPVHCRGGKGLWDLEASANVQTSDGLRRGWSPRIHSMKMTRYGCHWPYYVYIQYIFESQKYVYIYIYIYSCFRHIQYTLYLYGLNLNMAQKLFFY